MSSSYGKNLGTYTMVKRPNIIIDKPNMNKPIVNEPIENEPIVNEPIENEPSINKSSTNIFSMIMYVINVIINTINAIINTINAIINTISTIINKPDATINAISTIIDKPNIIIDKLYTIIEKPRTCSICICDIDDDISYTNCDHMYHKECLKNYIVHNINTNKSVIECPTVSGHNSTKCTRIFSHDDIQLITNDEELMKKFRLNFIKNDDKCRLCPCENSYCTKINGNWVTTCNECKSTVCFNCNKQHNARTHCFRVNNEMKKEINAFYKHNKEPLKMCPHCGFPQEHLSGCNDFVCGANYETSSNSNQNVRSNYGCGKKFRWNDAEVYHVPRKSILSRILKMFGTNNKHL